MTAKVKVVCLECGKRWQVSAAPKTAPQCSKCNSVDIDVCEGQ